MLLVSVRRAALAGVALCLSTAALASIPPTVPSAVGHFEAQNARWAKAAGGDASRGEALHYSPISHTPDQPYMSTSFFPAQALQIGQLTELKIDQYLNAAALCSGGRTEATIVLTDSTGHYKNFYGVLKPSYVCKPGAWQTINFVTNATWNGGTLAQADQAAKSDPTLGPNYKISIIRISYIATTNRQAWFDNESVNGLPFRERAEDLSANALLPDQDVSSLPTALGYFQTNNIRWNKSPTGGLKGESMHYSPWSHQPTAQDSFASTSFFPQSAMQLRDLFAMGFQFYLPAGSTCQTSSGSYAPFMVIIVTNASGGNEKRIAINHTDLASLCKPGAWHTLDFLNSPNTTWQENELAPGATTREAVHSAAVGTLGGQYKIKVIRIQFDGGAGPAAWFDNEGINGLSLAERAQDFTSDALLPDVQVLPDGTIPYLP